MISKHMAAHAVHEAHSREGLERWYAERGSRDMAYRKPLPPPRFVCACGEPAKRVPEVCGGGVACANCYPAAVS